MHESSDTSAHDAIDRFFELARNGETGNSEFSQLETMIYGRLLQTYAVDEAPAQGLVSQTAD